MNRNGGKHLSRYVQSLLLADQGRATSSWTAHRKIDQFPTCAHSRAVRAIALGEDRGLSARLTRRDFYECLLSNAHQESIGSGGQMLDRDYD
jgi:hypothetical protein